MILPDFLELDLPLDFLEYMLILLWPQPISTEEKIYGIPKKGCSILEYCYIISDSVRSACISLHFG